MDRGVAYEFMVRPPSSMEVPGRVIQKTFEDFEALDTTMLVRYKMSAPSLPPSTFLTYTHAEFISARGAALQDYIEAILQLEPFPRTQALRGFLEIWQPFPDVVVAPKGPLLVMGLRLPVGVFEAILGFTEPRWALRVCSAICKSTTSAARSPKCWPTLLFGCRRTEQWLERLLTILTPTCGSLQALHLSLAFEHAGLAVVLPSNLIFTGLRRLSLRLKDAEATSLAIELLDSVESPCLQRLRVEGCGMNHLLIDAVTRVAHLTEGRLSGLKLLWATNVWEMKVRVDSRCTVALQQLLDVVPALEDLSIGIPHDLRGAGVPRMMEPLQPPHVALPGTVPLLASTASMSSLQFLVFDFLSDDVLACLHPLAERSWRLRRATITGSRHQVRNADEAMLTVLSKLGEQLEEFVFDMELDAEAQRLWRSHMIYERIGELPALWQGRGELRSLKISSTAFDDDGMRCLLERCPQLHTLLFDQCLFWTDATVLEIVDNFPSVQHFRLRQSAMLSDRSVYALSSAVHRFTTIEIEPSYSMSHSALSQLQERCHDSSENEFDGGLLSKLDPSPGVVNLMAAIAGEPGPNLWLDLHDTQRSTAVVRKLGAPDECVLQLEKRWPEHLELGHWSASFEHSLFS